VTAVEDCESNCNRCNASQCTVLHRTCRPKENETRDEQLPYEL